MWLNAVRISGRTVISVRKKVRLYAARESSLKSACNSTNDWLES